LEKYGGAANKIRHLKVLKGMDQSDNIITIYNCAEQQALSGWQVVNDEVMGGRSEGRMSMDQAGNCLFSGNISLENNGGFSMVRYHTNIGRLANRFRQFKLKIKGDGREYQFRVKSVLDQRHSYGYYFATTGNWQEIVIPFNKLIPIFRGNQLSLPVYEGKNLQEVAFLTGKIPGNFRLHIQELSVL
jgi:hypothetical protein